MLAVWVYMAYAIIEWRASRNGARADRGPTAHGQHSASRVAGSALPWRIVLVLFVFGTYELIQPEGAGGGQGPSPIWTPASHTVLPIQVIGQQWKWTYRYPTFGGFETTQLVIPDDTTIAFHVTSLDVIHSSGPTSSG